MVRSTHVTVVGRLWWKKANTFEPDEDRDVAVAAGALADRSKRARDRIGRLAEQGSGPARACTTSSSGATGSVVQPRAVRTEPGLGACGPFSSADTPGRGSAASASSLTPAGDGVMAADQFAARPCVTDALTAGAAAPAIATPKPALDGATVRWTSAAREKPCASVTV